MGSELPGGTGPHIRGASYHAVSEAAGSTRGGIPGLYGGGPVRPGADSGGVPRNLGLESAAQLALRDIAIAYR